MLWLLALTALVPTFAAISALVLFVAEGGRVPSPAVTGSLVIGAVLLMVLLSGLLTQAYGAL